MSLLNLIVLSYFLPVFILLQGMQGMDLVQEHLLSHYDQASEVQKLKKLDLLVQEDGFIRLRKTFLNNKQEYYSMNLIRLKELRFLGSSSRGRLVLQTLEDDVIVQTYNDPKGNVDSMATELQIPLQGAEPEMLNELLELLEKKQAELKVNN